MVYIWCARVLPIRKIRLFRVPEVGPDVVGEIAGLDCQNFPHELVEREPWGQFIPQ